MEGDTAAGARLRALRERLDILRDGLLPQVRDLFAALLRDPNKAAATRELGLSRTAHYRRLQAILKLAEEQGLHEFLD